MIYYLAVKGYQDTLRWFCHSWAKELSAHIRFLTYDELRYKRSLPQGTYIFSDIERLDSKALDTAAVAWHTLTENENNLVLNDPVRSMRRYELLRTLHERKINDFDVYRLTEARRPARYPVFLRRENDHDGPISPLLHNGTELEDAIETLIRNGDHREDKIVQEFADVSDPNGVYHLFGAFVIGMEIVPAYLDFSRHWIVKGEVQSNGLLSDPEYVMAERHYVQNNPHETMLRTIFQIANIQYGRIDYAMVDGKICVFEINTNPNIIQFMDVGGDEWLPSSQRLVSSFVDAMKKIDRVSQSHDLTHVPILKEAYLKMWSRRLRAALHACLRLLGLLRYEALLTELALRIRFRFLKW